MILACDLGTGGVKASLYREDGISMASCFQGYTTAYRPGGLHEQRPADWWQGVCAAARELLNGKRAAEVRAVALSGFSMTAVPLDRAGKPLCEWVPIWSDARAGSEAKQFFQTVDREAWYRLTGSGDPPELYPAMKLMWLREHAPELWQSTTRVLGTKDYINYRLTGEMATDYSYASGSGVFDLMNLRYDGALLEAARLPSGLMPEPVEAHERIGRVTAAAACETGICEGTPVVCGGVDNTMMALGTTGARLNAPYTSLGSSAWIAVTSETPVLDPVARPFVFAFAQKGLYTSGTSIFAAGSALRWAAELLCPEVKDRELLALVNRLAEAVPPGANGVWFNPTLAGASPQEPAGLMGAFGGLSMEINRGDMLRAVMEGVALSLEGCCLGALRRSLALGDTMLLTGGGGKSRLWTQILADVYCMRILRSEAGQEAASRGAAMAALRGLGDAQDYQDFDGWLDAGEYTLPDGAYREIYERKRRGFARWIGRGAAPGQNSVEEAFER